MICEVDKASGRAARLKKCPFCGGRARFRIVRNGHWAECQKCWAMGGMCMTNAEAAKAWNKRV